MTKKIFWIVLDLIMVINILTALFLIFSEIIFVTPVGACILASITTFLILDFFWPIRRW